MTERVAPPLERLYKDAVGLADQARCWFDGDGLAWRAGLPLPAQARMATESLTITAQLMAAMAWLLDPVHAGGGERRPFSCDPGPEFSGPSPQAGTPGEAVMQSTRQLVERIAIYSISPPGTEADRVGAFDHGIWP